MKSLKLNANMVMEAIVEIEDMLNEAGIDEDDIYEIQGDLHDAIEEAAMYVPNVYSQHVNEECYRIPVSRVEQKKSKYSSTCSH